MTIKWKQLALCLAIPLAVGGLSGWLTRGAMEEFQRLTQPPLTPPGWVFPVVWTVLFLLMGAASYLVLTAQAEPVDIRAALRIYAVQLVCNFVWPLLFFNLGAYGAALLWLVILWVLIAATIGSFARISKPAAWLLAPYAAWVAFAGYLNAMIWWLN